MNVFFRLLKIYLGSTFSLSNLKIQISKVKTKNGKTQTKKSIGKIIGLTVLFIFLLVEFLVLFGFYAYLLYTAALAINNMAFLFKSATVIVSMMTLLFAFLTTAATYYIGEIEELFLAMPIKPRVLLGAKFFANCINSIITSLMFFGVIIVIYGINEHPPVIFYVYAILCAIAIPLPVISICYVFNILLMRFTRIFRNKNFIMMISSAVGICFSLGLNYAIQSMPTQGGNEVLTQKIYQSFSSIEQLSKFYPTMDIIGKILTQPTQITSIFYLFCLILITAVLPAFVIILMSNMYRTSLIGFGEKKIKKLGAKEVSFYIKKNVKVLPPIVALVKREFVMMNRTPIYLLNGPFSILFLPILLFVIFKAKGGSINSVPPLVFDFMNEITGAVVAGITGGALGSMTNIADSALSRDAKFIPVLKSFPINLQAFMYAKLIHSMIFAVFATIIAVSFCAMTFNFSLGKIVFASLISISLSGVLNLISLFLDTAHPKLKWDNPVAAMKQNTNVLIITFLDFIIFGLCVLILVLARNAYSWVLFIYFVFIPASIFAVLIKPYGIYAEQKLTNLEL